MAMLDEHLASPPKDVKDENSYTLDRIGRHNVVLALLLRTGKANAAMVAVNLHRSFPAVRFILMVGIRGGVPSPTTNDIQLGDVVICKPDLNSGGVVQYDYVMEMSLRSGIGFIELINYSPSRWLHLDLILSCLAT
jgi:nucleoside phosphorylase